jgi:hypothetical protein
MTRFALPVLLAVAAAGCSAATAQPYDSSDPVHCMVIFSATSGTARTGPLADELNARIVHIVRANGGAEWIEKITPLTLQIGAQWEASPDQEKVVKLFEECRSRQDADPSFKAALPQLMQEGRRISASAR